MRRRRSAIAARRAWATSRWAALLESQSAQALKTPRVNRVIDLLDLRPGKRYLDIGAGTAPYAHLLARRAGLSEPPYCFDISADRGPVDAIAWPEQLPLRDESFDAITCLYFVSRFDDDIVHAFAEELSRILAPGGATLIIEIAPVKSQRLNALHRRLLAPSRTEVDLRGWGRLAALFTECGFDAIDLVNVGPFLLPPIPRVGVLLRRAASAR